MSGATSYSGGTVVNGGKLTFTVGTAIPRQRHAHRQ